MNKIAFFLAGCLLTLPAWAGQVQVGEAVPVAGIEKQTGEKPVIEEFRLKNNLRVVVIPNPTVPAVNHMIWYRVGAADDPVGKSGLAHFAEHIMFKGTAKVPMGEFSKRVARLGGTDNAFTSHDYTAYFQKIAKEHLPLVMEMEADRMRNLTLNAEEIRKEREVVLEERQTRTENDVGGYAREQITAVLFQNHPYRLPVIGWAHEIAGLEKADIAAHVSRAYQPANAVLILSGDVTAAEAKTLAEKYYGAIPAGMPLARNWKQEPPARAEKKLTMTHPLAQKSQWARVYQAPSVADADKERPYALMLLSYLLGADKIGLLYEDLVVQKQLATAIDVSYRGMGLGPGQFDISVEPAPKVAMDALAEAVQFSLTRFMASPLSQDALNQAKSALTAASIYRQEGLQSMAFTLGTMLMSGLEVSDYRAYESRIQAVTAEQVQQAAQELFVTEGSVTAVLLPAQQQEKK